MSDPNETNETIEANAFMLDVQSVLAAWARFDSWMVENSILVLLEGQSSTKNRFFQKLVKGLPGTRVKRLTPFETRCFTVERLIIRAESCQYLVADREDFDTSFHLGQASENTLRRVIINVDSANIKVLIDQLVELGRNVALRRLTQLTLEFGGYDLD